MKGKEAGKKSLGLAFARCFLRCYFVGAGFNTRGLQNIGFSYAMQPGLEAIYSDPAKLSKARKRYVKHYNSHPFWAPLLVAIFLSVEMKIKEGSFPELLLDKLKNTTSYTLSAIGDSVFAGSGLIFWALATVNMLLAGHHMLAMLLGLLLFVGLQVFKGFTFWSGIHKGLGFLDELKKWDLINWGERLKFANAFLVLLLWFQLWPRPLNIYEWYGGGALAGVLSWLIVTGKIAREIVAVAVVVIAVLLVKFV
ncbi:PTS system mannose/fructose/sorbose family transporter subunit IID [Maridesulfovibrio hydrothermalis]|uniref:PTS system mannose/fructose/sorbose family IID component n=1 Tax=Maridesulfovibrio hydrothermalis AM13 = DSM 14728 TaxID=1121451 RepID=L0R9B7_9BACT|nr:PTS system mannose/fructose/sorbose family transporter subunit IID [Maridesulfovibrio hydrothermalis]CCO22785.1 PTS system mannose/fructose/sorbose family IID component [Maridesulfovibrio hydrothermalis AM13 = DSM 14728]